MGGADLETGIRSRHSSFEMSNSSWYGPRSGDVELAAGCKNWRLFESRQLVDRSPPQGEGRTERGTVRDQQRKCFQEDCPTSSLGGDGEMPTELGKAETPGDLTSGAE